MRCLVSDYAVKWPDVEPPLRRFRPKEQQLTAENCWFSENEWNSERKRGVVARKRQVLPVA